MKDIPKERLEVILSNLLDYVYNYFENNQELLTIELIGYLGLEKDEIKILKER